MWYRRQSCDIQNLKCSLGWNEKSRINLYNQNCLKTSYVWCKPPGDHKHTEDIQKITSKEKGIITKKIVELQRKADMKECINNL